MQVLLCAQLDAISCILIPYDVNICKHVIRNVNMYDICMLHYLWSARTQRLLSGGILPKWPIYIYISSLWVTSIRILTSTCMQCIYLYFYTPFERVTGWPGIYVSSEFQMFVGLCAQRLLYVVGLLVLHLKTASAPHGKLMWVLWFAILADLQRLLQPLCRIYSTFASRTFNLELAFE